MITTCAFLWNSSANTAPMVGAVSVAVKHGSLCLASGIQEPGGNPKLTICCAVLCYAVHPFTPSCVVSTVFEN